MNEFLVCGQEHTRKPSIQATVAALADRFLRRKKKKKDSLGKLPQANLWEKLCKLPLS